MAETYSIEAVLSARDEGFTAGMKAAMSASNSLGNKIKSGLGFGALMAIGNKAVSSIGNRLSGLVGDLSESSAAWKTFQGNMEMNNHTKKQIQSTKKELQKFAEQTIYSSSDMATTFAQLDAVGTKNTTKLVKGFGGLAAAAENPQQAMKTLSQQATQAAAKPKIQWMDFKLMLEQTPAGMAAVAKQMGISTAQLIKNVQDGKVKTEDFFEAIAKVGTNKQFTKLATEYKTVGQAMDGLTETASNKLAPAFDVVSGTAIKAVSGIVDSLEKVNGDSIAKNITSFGKKLGKYWNVLKTDAGRVGKAFGSAVTAIGKSMSKLNGSFGSAKSVNGFKSVLNGATDALQKFAGFCEKHADAIAKIIPNLVKLAVAYKALKIVKTIVPAVGTFAKAITKLAGKGIAAIAGKLFGVAAGERAVGSASMESIAQTIQAAKAFMMLGVGVLTIAAGFGIMAAASIALAESGGPAIACMVGMVAALAGLMYLASTIGPTLTAGATGFIALGAAVLIAGAGFYVMAQAAVTLSNGGTLAIACMVGMIAAIAALMAVAAALGPALTAGAAGFIALGAAVVMIGAGLALASVAIKAVTALVAQIGNTVAQVAASISVAVSAIVTAIGSTLVNVIQTAGNTISQIIASVGDAFTKLSDGITGVVDAISGGFERVLNGIAKVISSIGTSAKNAGEGFLSVAKGIEVISGLSLGSIVKSLGAVAIGLGKISGKASGLSSAANGLRGISSAVVSAGGGFDSLGSKASSAMSKVKSSMNGAANAALNAGRKVGTGFSQAMQSGLNKVPSIASRTVSKVNAKLQSGKSGAQNAGRMISAGFASGMSSCLGQIEAAASRMVSAADKAIRAKAKIHSPSRLTKALGRYIAIGLGNGIRSGIKSVTSASKVLASAATTSLRKAMKTRAYESAASTAIDKFKKSMNSKVSKVTKSLKKTINSGVKKLQKKNPKMKKAYSSVGKLLNSKVASSIKSQGQKAVNAADKALTALGKKYQEKYDKIASDRDNYLSKLSDYGNLYSSDSYGFIELTDFKAQKGQVSALAKNMEHLKKVLPYDMLKDIQDLDTASALKYTNELLKKSDSWLKQYGKDYTAFMSTAKNASNAYYQPYIEKLDKDYNSAVTAEVKKLKKQLNTIGKQATAGLVKGLTSKNSKKALKKAANDLASILTKSIKGKLKIHSPSRVMKSLAVYAGTGFVNGIVAMRNHVSNAIDEMVAIPSVSKMAFAGDFGGELRNDYDYYSRAEYTVVVPLEINGKEFARATASDMEEAQNKLQTRRNRKKGRR